MIVEIRYKQKNNSIAGAEKGWYIFYRILKYKPEGAIFNRKVKQIICNSFYVSDKYYYNEVMKELNKTEQELRNDIIRSLGLKENNINKLPSRLSDIKISVRV